MKTGIVYLITNTINGGKYVGITTQRLSRRWKHHVSHMNKYDYPLYRAFRKYGIENFKIKCIREIQCDNKSKLVNKLNELEIEYVSKHHSFVGWKDEGYNLTIGGGMENISSESRKKQGISMKQWYDSHPEFIRWRGQRIHDLHSSNPSYGLNIAQKLKQLYIDEPHRRLELSEKVKGSKHPLFDHRHYTFQNIVSGEKFKGTRFDFRSQYNLDPSKVCLLVNGKRKTHKDWKLL